MALVHLTMAYLEEGLEDLILYISKSLIYIVLFVLSSKLIY